MLCIGTLLCWHAYDVMFMGCNSHLWTQKNYIFRNLWSRLGQGHVTSLGHVQQVCEILSRSKMAVRGNGPDRFRVCVHFDLDLGDMTLGQGRDTPLGHGQQVCEILSISLANLAVRSNAWTRISGMCEL